MAPGSNSFEYAGLPTRVVLADGAVDRIAEYVDAAGGSRVMLVCGGTTARTRLVARVKAALGVRLVETFDTIVEHSGAGIVEEGARNPGPGKRFRTPATGPGRRAT